MARRRNPFNATKPAEWDSMSKKMRKAWNRRHWRPDQWKCDLALKKEATRLANRSARAGRGLVALAERMVERQDATNPGRCVRVLLPKGMAPNDHRRMKSWADWYKKHGRKKTARRNPSLLEQADEEERAEAAREKENKSLAAEIRSHVVNGRDAGYDDDSIWQNLCDTFIEDGRRSVWQRRHAFIEHTFDKICRESKKNPARRIPLPFRPGERISGRGLRAAFKKAFPKVNPYPHEHSARLREPTTMLPSSFRRKNVKGGSIGLIMAKPLTGRQVMTLQSVRFRAAHWSPTEARQWLRQHNLRPIMFEPATESRTKAWAAEGARGKKSRRAHRARALTRRRYA